jgi:MFS family permease
VLLAALGIGAIAGGLVLPLVRHRLPPNKFLLVAGAVYGLALIVVGLVTNETIVLIALVPAGVAWVTVLSNVNAEVQLFLPGWVRARGLAVYQVVFAGGQALGALAWGVVADAASLPVAHLAAGLLMIAGGLTVRLWPLPDLRAVERDPATYWPDLRLAHEPDPSVGPVLVVVSYTVRPECMDEFVEAMEQVRASRQRTGAARWGLYREGEAADRLVEVYQLASWDEHLRQHGGRLTGADRAAEQRAYALADGQPDVRHLLPAEQVP